MTAAPRLWEKTDEKEEGGWEVGSTKPKRKTRLFLTKAFNFAFYSFPDFHKFYTLEVKGRHILGCFSVFHAHALSIQGALQSWWEKVLLYSAFT